MRNEQPTKISTTAAMALLEKMHHYDKELDARVTAVNTALSAIVRAHSSAQELYVKRSEIAKELARLAPDEFASGAVTSAASPEMRWFRTNPLPNLVSPQEAFSGFVPSKGRSFNEDQEL